MIPVIKFKEKYVVNLRNIYVKNIWEGHYFVVISYLCSGVFANEKTSEYNSVLRVFI